MSTTDLFVARQPIFDAQHRIHGYELLYRGSAEAVDAGAGMSAASRSSSVIVGGVLGMGLERLTEGHRAFVNIPESLLLEGVQGVLDPAMVVVEILETVRATREVVEAVLRMKAQGFQIALDDFAFSPDYLPLLEAADIVKIDVIESSPKLERLVRALRPFPAKLLAEKVENAEVHARCAHLGFQYFQGFHYLRPETLTRKDVATATASIARLLSALSDMNVSDRAIEEAFRADPSLSYKLLRIVNSAALGGRGVDSIGHAMRLAGREPIQRWLSMLLLTVGDFGGEIRVELVKSALLRGRMCELLGDMNRCAARRDIPAGGALFLVGIFSHLDVLFGTDMGQVLADIRVSQEVRDALLSRRGPAGTLLNAVIAYSEGAWEEAERRIADFGLDPASLGVAFLDALGWAGAHMSLHRAA
ncbi:MAG: EAL domain-containing protein [Gemmatimonadetes bacterium]|nr:EAL domain-containing protein [Gemmatimonadota bacterium]